MDIRELPITHVFNRKDSRPIDRSIVAGIAESVSTVGFISPLTVRPKRLFVSGVEDDAFEVLAGGHRLSAAIRLGLEHVPCSVVECNDTLAQLVVIDENLKRSDLSPAERARQTALRKALYIELHPETAYGLAGASARWDADAKLAPAFHEETAAATGKSERSVQRDAERGQKISERALSLVAGTALDTGAYLDKLKKLEPQAQEARVQRELAEARKPVSPAPAPRNEFESEQIWLGKVVKLFDAAPQEWRERAREHLYPDAPVMDQRFG